MPHLQTLRKTPTQSCCPLCGSAPHPWAGRFQARKVSRCRPLAGLWHSEPQIPHQEIIWDNTYRMWGLHNWSRTCYIKHTSLCGPRRQMQQLGQTEQLHSTGQRTCPSVVQHMYKWPAWSSQYKDFPVRRWSHRINHLRRWKRLLATRSKSFHLNNRHALLELEVVWHGKLLTYSYQRVFTGLTLDRCLMYKVEISHW